MSVLQAAEATLPAVGEGSLQREKDEADTVEGSKTRTGE